MAENKRGRKPMSADRKKAKVTLTMRPALRNELERIADGHGLSMSEMVEKFVTDRLEAEAALRQIAKEAKEKAERKAAREARAAKKAQAEAK